jgi:predicted aconitase
MRTLIGALALIPLTITAIAPAFAADEVPAAHRIDLGDVSGVAYYTMAPDGLKVVATLGASSDTAPVRVAATLAPAQRIGLSVPGAEGTAPRAVDIVRDGDRILVMVSEPLSN